MADEVEVTTTEAVKKLSDGTVKISVEKYNELLETVADQKGSISRLNELLTKARNEPPVVNRTIVHKTVEMQLQDHRIWGGTFMTVGAGLFAIGALRYKAGTKS